ncbi:MAG: hypothetical protein GY796_21225, partial [Chloroflexi bacterium]|nr:hypothetical protein [Chloroflexota bacterium]
MNSQSKQLIRLFFVGIITCLFIASFSHSPIQTTYAQSASIDELRARVTEIGAYQFTADVEQTLIPRPVPSMIGKTNERLDMRIDGDVTLPDEAYLQIRLEGAGLNVPPLGIEQNGSDAFLLKDGERIQVENPAGLASPTADYLSYLAAAENLQQINPETVPAPEGFTRYVFDINGRQYAAYLQKQLQDNQPNDTPPQTSISISPALQKMNGRGELWLDANGLPRRQIIDLDIPALTSEYDARTHMVVDFAFGDTAATPLPDQLAPQSVETTADTPVPTTPQSPIPNLQSPISPTDFVIDIVLLLAASLLAAALIVGRRRRNLYTGVAISVVFIMVASPLFQVMGLSHFYSQQTHAQTLPTVPEALGVAPAEKTEMTQETRPFTKVSTPGTAATTATQCGTGDASLDSDNDGLDDFSETCLGTDPYYADTDRDLITDTLEIGGFQFNNLTWYSDPLQADSNQDGLADLFEWPAPIGAAPEWDPDNDNIPNLWDEDNDGDGVADNLDLSPFSVSVYSDTFAISTQRGDTYDGYQYIQVQFQPEDETHLRFSTNALDWPYDEEGQITDLDDSTDDLSLIPMLRITTNQEPDPSLASDYGITVLDNDDGTFDLYVPATYMGDGGKITAMEAKVAYESAALDAIEWQDIRFIWVAQMTIDQMVSGSGMSSETTPIHIYEEDSFRLTGWLVTKSSDFENAVLATPNTPEDDRTLFNLLFGLSSTFLSNQTPDIQTIGSRFSNPNTDPVLTWGVPAADVAISYTNTPLEHTDAGWLDLIARTGNLLTANGYATDGRMASVIIAMEQVSGSASMDDVTYTNGNNFDINLSGISLNTQRTLMLDTLTYTSDGWASMTEDEMLTAVINRYPDLTTILADLHLNYPDLSDVDLYEMLALFYASWSVGQSRTLSIDGVQTADDNTPDLEVYNAIYHPTETDLPGYLIEAANIGDSGSGLVIGNDLFSTWSYISEEEGDFVPPAFLSSIFALGQLTFNTDSNSVVITAGTRVAFAGAAIINIAFATYQIGSFLLKSGTSWANWFPRTAGGIGFSVVTTVISLAMIWISFAFTTDFSNQFAVREALVYAIVATIMVIAIAIISYTVVGSILVAIFYITDIILYFATDGDVQLYNTVIQSISDFFYSADQLV